VPWAWLTPWLSELIASDLSEHPLLKLRCPFEECLSDLHEQPEREHFILLIEVRPADHSDRTGVGRTLIHTLSGPRPAPLPTGSVGSRGSRRDHVSIRSRGNVVSWPLEVPDLADYREGYAFTQRKSVRGWAKYGLSARVLATSLSEVPCW
jgi:hypothetical protein